jgi:putative ABC transport system ATP-binding protein
VGLIKRKDHRPSQLSGGEQQRVAIARALTNRPSLLLADEPTGNLDSENSQQILSLLQRINQESGVTVVMVTHSMELAARCNRVIQVKDGLIA